MPWHSHEGDGATADTERYRELVAQRKRDEEMDRHLRVIHAPVPEPEPEGETEAPRTQRKLRRKEITARPKKPDYARRSRLRKEMMPGILYRFNAERAMVRDAENREKRGQAQAERAALIDDICGPRKRRKR